MMDRTDHQDLPACEALLADLDWRAREAQKEFKAALVQLVAVGLLEYVELRESMVYRDLLALLDLPVSEHLTS